MICELNTRYGTMFVPDTDSGQYWWLANTGASPEDSFIEAICELLDERPKGIAVDVGANFGCWTLPLSRHAHGVVAIEPQKACCDLLNRSIVASKVFNAQVHNVAAGNDPGAIVPIPSVDLNKGTNFGGVSLLQTTGEQPDAEMAFVPLVRVDDLVRGAPVSFIKADVEGFEDKVILGAQDTIRRCKPILFVEMDHPLTDKERLKELIESLGYATEEIGGNFLGMPL